MGSEQDERNKIVAYLNEEECFCDEVGDECMPCKIRDDYKLMRSQLALVRSQKTAALARAETAEKERDELREVVEKLPKTADGVPVFPGDFVWYSKNPSDDTLTRFKVSDYTDWKASVWDGKTEARCVSDQGGGWPVRVCYSTREAALAARERGGEG